MFGFLFVVLALLSLLGTYLLARRSWAGNVFAWLQATLVLVLSVMSSISPNPPPVFPWLAVFGLGWGSLGWVGWKTQRERRAFLQSAEARQALFATLQQHLSLQEMSSSARWCKGTSQLMQERDIPFWLRYEQHRGNLSVILGASSSDIPQQLSLSTKYDPQYLDSALPWYPTQPDRDFFHDNWAPNQRLYGSHVECLGTLHPKSLEGNQRYFIEGDEQEVLPCLDERSETQLRELSLYGDLELKEKTLTLLLPADQNTPEELLALSEQLLRTVAHLSVPPHARVARLAKLLKTSQDRRLQIRYLELLQHLAPRAKETRDCLEWASTQPEPRLQMLAAYQMKRTGIPIFHALFRNTTLPSSLRSIALSALLERIEPDEAATTYLTEVFASNNDSFWNIALDYMAKQKAHFSLATLYQWIATPSAERGTTWNNGIAFPPDKTLSNTLYTIAALTAFQKEDFASSGIESLLVLMLEHSNAYIGIYGQEYSVLQLLATFGTAAALNPLYKWQQQHPGRKKEAKECRLQIEARLGPGMPGALTLSNGEEDGQLSVAEIDNGELSLVETNATERS